MLTIRLLGHFAVHYRGIAIQLKSRPAQKLLAQLALTAGVKHRREVLAHQLWPDANKENAFTNLRHVLWRIRKALHDAGADDDDYILADDIEVGFNGRSAYWLDAKEIEQAARRMSSISLADLTNAADLYLGDLLPGFDDDEDPDDWVGPNRTRLKLAFDDLMAVLSARLRDETCWQDLIRLGRHWAEHGNNTETAYREIMIGHCALGDTSNMYAIYDECSSVLDKRFGLMPSDQTEHLLHQLVGGTYPLKRGTGPTPSGMAAKPASPPTNLPDYPTPFVGREADLADIAAHLAQADCRLLTLMGPGGIGKTRLSIEAATRALAAPDASGRYADGVYLARLEAATTTEALVVAMADAVRLPTFGQEQPKGQLLNFLREKHMLLALDNFEQLLHGVDGVDGAAVVAEVIAAAPGVTLLVTSRERLHLPEEHLLELDGLDYPDSDVGIALRGDPSPAAGERERGWVATEGDPYGDAVPTSYAAVQLFLQTARRIYPRFDVAAELGGVVHICRLTQGMPLAIELAAAWVRALSCNEVAARIRHNLDVLAVADPNMSARHRSIRAVLDYSWKLLSAGEQQTFAALSAFRGGFGLEAAEAVARISVSALYALIDKSLLRRTPAGRYEMHDLVRVFGEEKLDAVEDEDWRETTVHARMARYFLQFAKDHPKDYAALEPEWANFLAALRAAHERYEWPIVTELAQTLIDPWFTRARFTDAREGLRLASLAANADDDLPALANVLRWRGRACIEQGDYDEAEGYLRTGLQFCEQTGNELDAARNEYDLARICLERSNHAEAERLLTKSSAVLQRLGDEEGYAAALYRLASMHYIRANYDEAQLLCKQALEIQQRLDNKRACIPTLRLLALLLTTGKDTKALHKAKEYGSWAYKLAKELMDWNELPGVLYTLSQTERHSGELIQAREDVQHAYKLWKQMGERKSQANALFQLSMVNVGLDEWQQACEVAQQSLVLYRDLGDEWTTVRLMLHLGDMLVRLKRSTEARDTWQEGLALATRLDHPNAAALRERLAAANDRP